MREVAVHSGLLFDPNYMIKTFLGMRDLIRSGVIPGGSSTVLVHTGGQLGLFGAAPAIRRWYDRARVDGGRVADETSDFSNEPS